MIDPGFTVNPFIEFLSQLIQFFRCLDWFF